MKCRKVRYVDRLAADIALAESTLRSKRNSRQAQHRDETRAYLCPDCKGWHLSSSPR